MKLLSYGFLLAFFVVFTEPVTAQIPIPKYLSQFPKEEADVLRKAHLTNRAKAMQAAGHRSVKEYKTKPGGEKRLIREYFFDVQGRFTKVETYSPKGIMGEVEKVEYHPGTSDQKLYIRSSVEPDGREEIMELERYNTDGFTTEKIDLGPRYKREHITYRFGKDGKVVEQLARSYENRVDGDTVRIKQNLASSLSKQVFFVVYIPEFGIYQQGIKELNADGYETEFVVAKREWTSDMGMPPLIYNASGDRVINQDDVHLYLQEQTVDIDPPFELFRHFRFTFAAKGKLSTSKTRNPDGEFGTTAANTYNDQGRLLTSTWYSSDGTGDTKTYKYNAQGKLIYIEEENTNYTFEYHPNGTIKRYYKDNQGGKPNFKTVEEVYGEDGRILWNLDRLGFGGGVRETRYEYQYDPNGVLLKMSGTSYRPISEVTFEPVK